MGGIVVLVFLFVVFGLVLGVIAFLAYRRVLRKAKAIERGLKMVPLLIHLPPPSDDTENSGNRDVRDIMREKISQAQVLYDLIAGTAKTGFKSKFYGQRHIAFEIIASNGLVHYFTAVPVNLVSVVEQAIVTAYPGARLEEVEDHNIFNPQGHLTGTAGGELILEHEAAYPIATLDQMERDPMVGLLNALSKLQLGDGAAVQIMLRPAGEGWMKRAQKLVANKRHQRQGGLGFSATDIAKAAVKTPEEWRERDAKWEPSKLEEEMLQAIEEKTKHPGYEVLIRVITASHNYDRAQMLLRNMTASFALFDAPGSNGFKFVEGRDMQGLITAFIFRFFPPELTSTVLNSVELATLFHLPDAQFTPTTQVERQQSKQVDGPVNMPTSGLLMGYNFFRGVKKEIRLSENDRRRHTYIVGQTGTGKSTILENLAVQDMLAGNGFAFIDPHGDTAEKLISMVPKERAEDIIYFNPGDMEHPLGLNLFEYSSPEQKDFLIQESINMLYKLYDPQKTGIIGPRFEHWYRNAALTLMADPNGASFIEIPKVFTDSGYLKNKFKYLNDPTVIDFWTKEMGQTSDYHKSEMLGWFVSKFGAFQSNEMMRNIIGQTKSAFNIRDIMDNKKILIVNLGKGRVGELNSQLLGMIFVIKIQAAAMSRSTIPEDQRADFCLYVDEFQNFSTESFASILSEARKYRLNLIVANQFIGQLTDEIRDAVFGNVGTMMSYRTGPEDAEFLVKQYEPIFDEQDLVKLPNYNAVMKLLIGGLPSQPFSLTALPPLGQPHAEMGLAIKQLSAAKYGVPRGVVEADIFARLQNQPRVAPPPPAPVVPTPAAAPTTPPVTVSPAPVSATNTASPALAPAPAIQQNQSHESLLPQPPRATIQAPQEAIPVKVVETPQPQPQAQAPAPAPATPSAAPSSPGELKISEIAKPPAPKTEPLLIEAHETDGRTDEPIAAKETPSATPKPEPLLIEAHEEDGKIEGQPESDKAPVQPSTQEPSVSDQVPIAAPVSTPQVAETTPIKDSGIEPTPEPKPEPASEPVTAAAPSPTPTPTPEPVPESAPEPTPPVEVPAAPAFPVMPEPKPVEMPTDPVKAPEPAAEPGSQDNPNPQPNKSIIRTHRSHRMPDAEVKVEEPAPVPDIESLPEAEIESTPEPTVEAPAEEPVQEAKPESDNLDTSEISVLTPAAQAPQSESQPESAPSQPSTEPLQEAPENAPEPIEKKAEEPSDEKEEPAAKTEESSNQAKEAVKEILEPDPVAVASGSNKPDLKPGEVFVDEDGNIVQG